MSRTAKTCWAVVIVIVGTHFSSRQARLLRAAIAFKPALGRHPIPDTAGMN